MGILPKYNLLGGRSGMNRNEFQQEQELTNNGRVTEFNTKNFTLINSTIFCK